MEKLTSRVLSRCGYDRDKRPFLLELRSSKWFIVTCVTTAIFTDIFLYAVIVPVIPFALRSRVGVPDDEVQYWVSILLAVDGAALLVSCPFWGWIADHISNRRGPFVFGLLVLIGATACLALGKSITLLVLGRILHGISGAMVWISSLALLVDTVGPDGMGQAVGFVGTSLSLGLLLAPMLGGIVSEKAGYEAVFAMCWGTIGLDIVLRLLVVEKKVAVRWLGVEGAYGTRIVTRPQITAVVRHSTDPEKAGKALKGEDGSIESTVTLQIATAEIIHLPRGEECTRELAHVSPPVNTTIHPDQRHVSGRIKARLPLLTLLASPRFLASMWATVVQAALITALDCILPLLVKDLFHWNSLGAGLVFLPITIPSFAAPVLGWWVDRHGPRLPAALSFICAVPFLILLRVIVNDHLASKVGLFALLFGVGISLALALPPIMTEMAAVVVEIERARPGIFGTKGAMAQAYSLFNFSFAGGCLIGPVWGGMINKVAGWGTVTWTLALLSFVTAFPVFALVGGPVWRKQGPRAAQV